MRTLHTGLRVTDLDRSVVFYVGLGYEVSGEVPISEFASLTMLKLPGDEFVSIELVNDRAGKPTDRSGLHHLVVRVEDVHEHVYQLAGQGFRVEVPTSPDGSNDSWTAWLTDPDGHRIELVQRPPGHPEGMTQDDLTGFDRVQQTGEPAQRPTETS